MKKLINEYLNEDINITDPALSQQYTQIQQQILDKQKLINNMNNEILVLQKNMGAIEQKSAANQKPVTQPTQTTTPAPTQATATPAQQPAKTESYHSIPSLDKYLSEALEDPTNIDAMNILNVVDDKYETDDETFDQQEKDEEPISDEYVFYVKVEDDGEEFIGKIYKNDVN